MKRIFIFFGISLILCNVIVFSDDGIAQYPPSLSVEVMNFFLNETKEVLSVVDLETNKSERILSNFFAIAYLDILFDYESLSGLFSNNFSLGTNIRLNKNILLPIYAYTAMNTTISEVAEATTLIDMFIGSGLVLQNILGTYGFYGGYYGKYFSYIGDYEYLIKYFGNYIDDPYSFYWSESRPGLILHDGTWRNSVKFSFVPIINVSKFPLLGIIWKTLEGYFGLNETDFISSNYSLNLLSWGFSFGKFSVNTIGFYTKKEHYNLEANSNVWGIKTSFSIFNTMLLFDFGNIKYNNIIGNKLYYQDSYFFRPMVIFERIGLGITAYFDNQNNYPKIGILYFYDYYKRKDYFFGEVGYMNQLNLKAGTKGIITY
jgi:hypothetical protein